LDQCKPFEDEVFKLCFDPKVNVAGGQDAEQVVMAGQAGSLHDMLSLQDVGWEGSATTRVFNIDGTTAGMNT